MKGINRRQFIQVGVAMTAFLNESRGDHRNLLQGKLKMGGEDYSPTSGKQREMIPTACWQCVTRDAMVGFVEKGRIVKLEGHPDSIRTRGKMCAKGQGGIGQVYDPDRLLYPMKRVGPRGSGKWKRITWSAALEEIGGWLAELKLKGEEERFAFHYGRMKGSSSKMIKSYFLPAFGTKTIMGHTSICEGSKWVGQEMVWGKHYDSWDVETTKLIINFGSNVMVAGTNHIPVAQRLSHALAQGVPLYTFDVRLSETAAKSTEWLPIKPGTDGAIMLAMLHTILNENLVPAKGKQFIEKFSNTTIEDLKKHISKEGYTAQWAEKISGVKASKIQQIARLYAKTHPAVIMTYRGVASHYNGTMGERISLTLQGVCGNIDVPGGVARAVSAKWKNSYKTPKAKKKLKIGSGQGYIFPTHGVCQNVLEMIEDGSQGRPFVYMWYCYTPVFANGDMAKNQEILKNEKLIPHTVCISTSYDESAVLADILLPDATYLERWDWEDMVSPDQIAEYYIRQPVVPPPAQVRDFKDILYELGAVVDQKANLKGKSSITHWLPFKTAKEFVKDACAHTKGVKEAGGFDYMVKQGVWHDKKAKPKYLAHEKVVATKMKENWAKLESGLVYDKSKNKKGEWDKKGGKNYVGHMIEGKIYHGFPPDKGSLKTHRNSGLFTIRHDYLAKKSKGKYPALPSWVDIPGHAEVDSQKGKLILTTFKVATQIHSRSQNCKYLSEVHHSEPAWIHPQTAKLLGVSSGDDVILKSKVGQIKTAIKITPRIHPDAIALAHHFGHWEYGKFASGKPAVTAGDNAKLLPQNFDYKNMWWKEFGVRPNWIIPNEGDPIGGGMTFMDTVVEVRKV